MPTNALIFTGSTGPSAVRSRNASRIYIQYRHRTSSLGRGHRLVGITVAVCIGLVCAQLGMSNVQDMSHAAGYTSMSMARSSEGRTPPEL